MQCLQTLEKLGIALDGGKKGFVEHDGSSPSVTGMGHGEGLGSASASDIGRGQGCPTLAAAPLAAQWGWAMGWWRWFAGLSGSSWV